MNKIKCSQCGEILESKFRHDFQQCQCSNETFIDGGNDYCRCGGKDPTKIEFIPTSDPIGPQKQPSSVAKIEAEKKYTMSRLKEIEKKND